LAALCEGACSPKKSVGVISPSRLLTCVKGEQTRKLVRRPVGVEKVTEIGG
jgi:hypothetical protein